MIVTLCFHQEIDENGHIYPTDGSAFSQRDYSNRSDVQIVRSTDFCSHLVVDASGIARTTDGSAFAQMYR